MSSTAPPASCENLPEPLIIPRAEHGISRKNIDSDALKVLYRLHNHGHKAYLVGGGVRDLLLGRRPKDFDISTSATPSQVRRLFKNSRVIGKRFRLVQVFFRGGKIIEVSTFRRAGDATEGENDVLCANNTYGTPAEDALRRDLTINALFYNIADYSVVDYVNGLADLKAGLVRGVGDSQVRFHRDPVRVLRAIRHAARASLDLTPEALEAIQAHGDKLALCPTSRVRDELMRDLKGGAAADWLELAHATGVLYHLLPTLEPYYGAKDSQARAQARELMAKVDRELAGGRDVEDPVVVCLLFWPALEVQAAQMEFAPGRQGRAQWSVFVRDALPALTKPVAFAKRVMERAGQIAGLMAFVRWEQPGQSLPKKVTTKGYFPVACELARHLGHDLGGLDRQGAKSGSKSKRRRRRRRKPRRKSTTPAQG
ncbi:MAG: polynucleotide adenylyltransferase PcnB [Desulfarculaceae bacterium]|nr:polynucleotide adenylyltransferase PcnB [Desulfarculaceae bacterium]MCF8072715.1 polynucleotide adenylyltransferase PcnB [Desulfarculaceae bacterium]MCF8102594.1 polynucleotide adenylyltransferase PcnB [Desulfarculaceae bacterium]MCF8116503.1 polynucleotide adenylyltransferase PcnB [Desulfarculaceae bacterium]